MYSPFKEEVHVLTVHPSMHSELAQVAGMALFIFTKLDTAHNGRLVQPQSEILSEERVERRGEGRVEGRGEGRVERRGEGRVKGRGEERVERRGEEG